MPRLFELDELDLQLLALLLQDSSRPYTDLAKQLQVSSGTIHVRMKKLTDAGVVKGHTLVVDPTQLGFDITAFLGIYLDKSSLYGEVSEKLKQITEVISSHYTTGGYSVFVKVLCRDTNHLREILHKIQKIEGIQRTETLISLEESISRPIQILESAEMEALENRRI